MKNPPTAFPFVCQDVSKHQCHEPGMDLRDYFAAAALPQVMAVRIKPRGSNEEYKQMLASVSYDIADAMLAEREKRQ